MVKRVSDWLDARTGHREWLDGVLAGEPKGSGRWSRALGTVAWVLLAVEALTGVGLAAYYAPTTTDAWASVEYIQNHVWLGWLLRGLHHYGASALVIAWGLHLLQLIWGGAYRAPKELNWMISVLVLLLALVTSHLGFLLPGDLRGYWATQVMLGIAGNQPLIGRFLEALLQGGPAFGNLTFTRLYSLHAIAAPAAIALLALAQRALVRRYQALPTKPPRALAIEAEGAGLALPSQLLKSLLASLAAVGGVLAIVLLNHGAALSAPADPSIEYLARPEWYFLPIFQLRHYFTGDLEFIATSLLPGLAAFSLLTLPFLHARLSRSTARARPIVIAAVLTGVLATASLGALSALADLEQPEAPRLAKEARALSEQAQRLASIGVPVAGPLELYKNDAVLWGTKVFTARCETCHHRCATKPYKGDVCLEGYASRTWLTKLISDPANVYFFGNGKIDEMDAWTGSEEGLSAIVEFVYSQGNRPDVDLGLAERGRTLYEKEGCEACHALDGLGTGQAPDLRGYGSPGWLSAFIRDPASPTFYGGLNEMDAFPCPKLSDVEVAAVVSYLRAQTDAQAKFP